MAKKAKRAMLHPCIAQLRLLHIPRPLGSWLAHCATGLVLMRQDPLHHDLLHEGVDRKRRAKLHQGFCGRILQLFQTCSAALSSQDPVDLAIRLPRLQKALHESLFVAAVRKVFGGALVPELCLGLTLETILHAFKDYTNLGAVGEGLRADLCLVREES